MAMVTVAVVPRITPVVVPGPMPMVVVIPGGVVAPTPGMTSMIVPAMSAPLVVMETQTSVTVGETPMATGLRPRSRETGPRENTGAQRQIPQGFSVHDMSPS